MADKYCIFKCRYLVYINGQEFLNIQYISALFFTSTVNLKKYRYFVNFLSLFKFSHLGHSVFWDFGHLGQHRRYCHSKNSAARIDPIR